MEPMNEPSLIYLPLKDGFVNRLTAVTQVGKGGRSDSMEAMEPSMDESQ